MSALADPLRASFCPYAIGACFLHFLCVHCVLCASAVNMYSQSRQRYGKSIQARLTVITSSNTNPPK